MADNIGEIYVEISARMDKLEKQLNDSLEKAKRTGKGIEDAFKNKIISLDNALAQKSIQDLEKSAQRLKEHLEKKISLGAPAYQLEALQNSLNKAERAVVMFKKTAETVPQTINKGNQAVGNMNMTMGQLGFLIGDADMFFVNFRMGMMSIANNVPMVVQGLMQAKAAAESSGQSFSKALAGSLMGPGGVMIGINALMFALNVLPQLFNDTTDQVKEQAREVSDLASEYENLTKQQLLYRQAQVQSDLAKMTQELQAKYGGQKSFLGIKYNSVMETKPMTEEERVRYETLLNENQALDNQLKKTGLIKDLDNQINTLLEKRSTLPADQVHAYDKWIKTLKEQRAKLDEGINPKEGKQGKESDVQRIIDEEKKLKAAFAEVEIALKQTNLSDFTRNELLVKQVELLKELHKWDKVAAAQKEGLGGIKAGGFMGIKGGGGDTMMPQDGLSDLKSASENGFNSLMKQFAEGQQAAESFANSISNGFANAIMGGQSLAQIFSNLAVQLGTMVIQAVAFKAIMAAFNLDTGGSSFASLATRAFGGGQSVNIAGGGTSAPINQSLGQINSSIQAMNVNMMSKGNAPVNVYMDGKIVATLTSKHQAQMAKGNVKV